MIKFPSISQFRNTVQHVRQQAQFKGLDDDGNAIMDRTAIAPTLSFIGTVKLHGTNAAIVFKGDTSINFQSRERVLTVNDDNAGFCNHFTPLKSDLVLGLRKDICKAAGIRVGDAHEIAVYGEWCGGNIQNNVAIAGLPKMFVIFAIKINDEWFTEVTPQLMYPELSIHSIHHYAKWFVTIDFENPERSLDILVRLTEKVEEECPVGKYLGQSGIGEGIVWRCIDRPSSDYWFKVKGEKHSASKVKVLVAVDAEAIENMKAFVELAVSENRLEQGLQNLLNEQGKPFDMTSMGDFIRWIHGDVLKEESDTIQASGFDPKKLGSPIALVARRWYAQKLNAAVMA
jgi:hypothetical protein